MLLEYVLLEMAKLSSGKQNETHRTAEQKDDFQTPVMFSDTVVGNEDNFSIKIFISKLTLIKFIKSSMVSFRASNAINS